MRSRAKRPTAIDVFCGCGGATAGLKKSGFRVLAGVELSEAAAEAFRLNHPEVELYRNDIRDLHPAKLLRELGLRKKELDLLIGCSPCQGFSRMRTRNRREAADDPRNDLVFEFVRLTKGLLPKAIVFENVPGLMHDTRFAAMVQALEHLGYSVSSGILELSQYGVPQRRKRLILTGSRAGRIGLPTASGRRMTVRDAIGGLPRPAKSADPLQKSVTAHSDDIKKKIAKIPKNGGSRIDLGEDEQLPCHTKVDGFHDVYGRMSWNKPSPTITRFSLNPSKGRYLHPTQNRAISLREAALLQTLPPSYKFPLEEYGRGAVASMIGEVLPPLFAEQLAYHVQKHLEVAGA